MLNKPHALCFKDNKHRVVMESGVAPKTVGKITYISVMLPSNGKMVPTFVRKSRLILEKTT